MHAMTKSAAPVAKTNAQLNNNSTAPAVKPIEQKKPAAAVEKKPEPTSKLSSLELRIKELESKKSKK